MIKKIMTTQIDLYSKRFWMTIIPLTLILMGLFANVILVQQKTSFKKAAAGGSASLELLPSLGVPVNQEFTIPVMLNTDGVAISAVDLNLAFDRQQIQLIDIIPQPQNSSLKTFTPLDSNGNFKKSEVVQQANQTGTIKLSAVAFDWKGSSLTSGFNGILGPSNSLVLLRFKALQSGQTAIVIVNSGLGSGTDSNIVRNLSATDILTKVTNLALSISSPTSTPNPNPTSTPTPSPTPTPTPSPSPTPVIIPSPVLQITLPDLAVTDIKFYRPGGDTSNFEITSQDLGGYIGQNILAKAVLVNQGQASTGYFNIKWFLNNDLVGYGSHDSLAAGQTSNGNVRYNWLVATGTQNLRFEADVDRQVTEDNEANNSFSMTIVITAPN